PTTHTHSFPTRRSSDLPGSPPLLRHGQARDQRFLDCCWDRLNGETVFMYVLAAGAAPGHAVPASAWQALRPFYGRVAGLRFHSADRKSTRLNSSHVSIS